MKRTSYYCDVCSKQLNKEGTNFKFQGYVGGQTHGWLFKPLENCCGWCRGELVESIRKVYQDKLTEIQGRTLKDRENAQTPKEAQDE